MCGFTNNQYSFIVLGLYKTVFTTQNNKKILTSSIVVVLCFSLSSFYLFEASKIGPYLTAQQGSGTIYQDYYVDPKTVHFSFPEQKRNLIYIYGIDGADL